MVDPSQTLERTLYTGCMLVIKDGTANFSVATECHSLLISREVSQPAGVARCGGTGCWTRVGPREPAHSNWWFSPLRVQMELPTGVFRKLPYQCSLPSVEIFPNMASLQIAHRWNETSVSLRQGHSFCTCKQGCIRKRRNRPHLRNKLIETIGRVTAKNF